MNDDMQERVRPNYRFDSELHYLFDSELQGLVAIAMQLDVLRRKLTAQNNPLDSELARLQEFMVEDVSKIRERMQSSFFEDLDSSTLLAFLKETTERFQRETGIAAQFVSELNELQMPPQVCRALARIVQEGLVRVRSHSDVKHIQVRLSATDSHWKLAIEDDASRGYPNRLMIIEEGARAIDGEVAVESNRGGSRLVVTVPMTTADETQAFTEQELKFIFGVCSGLANKDIAQQYGMTGVDVMHCTTSVYEKAGVSTRVELYEFVRTALNGELRRRQKAES